MRLPKLGDFLKGLQRSWKVSKKWMEMTKEVIKMQFNKKRQKSQGLKKGNNVWLEAKNIHWNLLSKKLDQKRYGSFRITKNIRQGVFQLELLEGWMVHNVFNENILTWCREPYLEEQHMDSPPPLDIINEEKEYEVKEVQNHRK